MAESSDLDDIYDIPVVDIYLDVDNPRHDRIEDQREIISHLIKKEHTKKLAADIAINGLSPLDALGVIEENGKYIVIEGNRRTCACKLLNDPELAPAHEREYFKKIRNNALVLPNTLPCVIFKTREQANIWIERRHEGEQSGIGTKNWDATQKSRHNTRRDKGDANALSLSILDYATKYNLMGENKETQKLLTTLTRYLSNPEFRRTFGISSGTRESVVKIKALHEEFERAIKRLLFDIINNKISGSRSKIRERQAYLTELMHEGVTPHKQVPERLLKDREKYWPKKNIEDKEDIPSHNGNQPAEQSSANNAAEDDEDDAAIADVENTSDHLEDSDPNMGDDSDNQPSPPVRQDSLKRKYLIPPNFKATINNKHSRKARNELKSIEVNICPLAVALTLRAFLETTYIDYQKSILPSTYKEKQDTNTRLEKIVIHLENNKELLSSEQKSALGALKRIKSNEDSTLSHKTLGAYAHIGHYPVPSELIRAWDNIEEIIKYLLNNTP